MSARIASLVTAGVLLASLAACSGEDGDATPGASGATPSTLGVTTTVPTTAEPTTTPSLPGGEKLVPGGAPASERRPLRVLLAGDSVMYDLANALRDGLETGGTATTSFLLTPSIIQDRSVRLIWQQQRDDVDPDVIVFLIGTWEAGSEIQAGRFTPLPGPGWQAVYTEQVLDPWLEFLTGDGSHVVWVGMPKVPKPESQAQFTALNAAYATAAAASGGSVTFVDGARVLSNPAGEYVDRLTLDGGSTVRLRRKDLLHLCPAGAVLLAEPVLATLADQYGVEIDPTWVDGPWRQRVEKPEECQP